MYSTKIFLAIIFMKSSIMSTPV